MKFKGQWIILTALAVVIAVAAIYMAYVSSTIVPVASIQRPAYGIMSQDWPELVQLLAGYAQFLAQSGASKASIGALDAGLYNNLVLAHPADAYFQLRVAQSFLGAALSSVEQSLLPLGTFITANFTIDQRGFGGTLGPYPAALRLSDAYNFTYWINSGAMQVLYAYRLYRFVVSTQVPVQTDYVIIYSADVRRPTSVGESYSVPVEDILNLAKSGGGYDVSLLKDRMYLILVNNTALEQALQYLASPGCTPSGFRVRLSKAFVQIPWWSEYIRCPFCLFDFKMPAGTLTAPGYSDEVMVVLFSQPTRRIQLALNIPLMLYLSGINPAGVSPSCYSVLNNQYSLTLRVDPTLNNNPYAVYNIGGAEYFYNAAAMSGWPSSIVYSTCHQVGPENQPTPIEQLVPTSVYGNATTGLLLGAVYPPDTYDVGYQIWTSMSVPQSWPGFQVRTLINVTSIGSEKMGYLALFWGGYDGSTFPWCADMIAVQPESYPPTFVWSYQPQGYLTGPWQTYSWQYGGSYVPLSSNRWYVLSISEALQGSNVGQAYLAVYKFLSNSSGPMTPYVGQWVNLGTALYSFNVVLGTDTEDFPQSGATPWTDAAIYDFLAVRPWVYPEPSAVLTTLGAAPVLSPPRPTVIAWGRYSLANASVTMLGNISLALVTDLNITQRIVVNASTRYVVAQYYSPFYVKYIYGVLVKSNVPRSTLASSFTLVYNYGGVLYNYTCGASPMCNQTLVTYYGYFNGVDKALFNVSVLVPRHSNFAVVLNLLGAQIAVNNLTVVHPQVYYLWSGNSLYLVNVGNMDAVFYFPWQSGAPVVASIFPNDGVFGAAMDIAGNGGSWTLVIVPAQSAVNVTFAPTYVSQIRQGFPSAYSPQWELPYISAMSFPSTNCRILQVYFPSEYTGDHLVLVLPPIVLANLGFSNYRRLAFYIFSKGSWVSVPYAMAYWNDVWLRINQYRGWFAYRGSLISVCTGGSPTSMYNILDMYIPKTSGSYAFNPPIGLSAYPNGFAIIINLTGSIINYGSPEQYLNYIYLANTTNPSYTCIEGTYAGRLLEIWNGFASGTPGWTDWWNQYASVCGDQSVWTTYGSGVETYFIIALTPQFANFHIATESGNMLNPYNMWWYNGWPNTAYNPALFQTTPTCSDPQQCNGPLWSFNYLVVSPTLSYGIDVIPYMWPLPYVLLDGNIYQTI
ncbi:hypothetical protein [Thermoproteus tenax]|uniref:Uncharacterized protein n=1 Tax=Thermoproteus tenax (strain ATCC 35583 / DSM 2078 / JCM 9277 / NBRC 100435 / Kra 1) TaxID=768679 RepID=G4RPP8_THETK|nr:hypothetical protein [Thermoproteus tenax]CCC81543.1 hypothetical protein TTX_0889 [Thermoproteus tenax Kra 1]